MNKYFLLFLLVPFIGCSSPESNPALFESLNPAETNVLFENNLTPSEEFNMYIFRNFYNGGGVAAGDLSGNGLPDLFFTGNMTSNRLYFNKGNFEFEDVTESAGLLSDGYWSTGASLVDINGNGRLDIFITLSGPPEGEKRHNRLYINNGDGTFTEKSKEYGLDDIGLSTHAVFFDYNGNGLMDMYLINNSFRSVGGYQGVTGEQRKEPDQRGASKLYRNEGGSFTDVTEEAGIYSSIIGFGLSATVADVNRDGYPDLYVTNDFFERDYLYINNGDGTFTESLEEMIRSLSFSSMGSDIADLNNDGWPEIYVSDMLPEEEKRLKSKMTIETWDEYADNVYKGFHHKYTRNTLQLNRGDGTFSEIGRYADVYATDWSWAVLMADFNLSGYNDIFVTNGIYKDLLDQDYIEQVANPRVIREMMQSEDGEVIMRLLEEMSSYPISNYAFANSGNLRFDDQTTEWGLDEPGFSSGAVWADLNGNGALDLVVNNVNGPSKIYKNRVLDLYPERTWLKIKLQGESPNTHGIGAQLQVWSNGDYWYREHILQRGFQSSVEPGFHIGFNNNTKIDSLAVRWPDSRTSWLYNIELPASIRIDQSESTDEPAPSAPKAEIPGDDNSYKGQILFEKINEHPILDWAHKGYNFVDFDREGLLTHMRSTQGPAMCVGDATGNGLDDLFIGGGRGQFAALFVQDSSGIFYKSSEEVFEEDAISEDTDCAFFDATGNGSDDLYVVSGGNSFGSSSSALSDRLYLNDGTGNFQKSEQILPTQRRFESGSVVKAHDFTGDGNVDLFVGSRLRPFGTGLPVNSYLLEGDGDGAFTDVTEDVAPELVNMGMVTDALWADITGNGSKELIVTGEWMPVRVFSISNRRFTEITEGLGLENSSGWWNTIHAVDLNNNGRLDLIAGGHGKNSKFHADKENPVKMWVGDFVGNGMTEQIMATAKNGQYYPVAHRHELIEQIPSLRNRYPDYESFAGVPVEEIFSDEVLSNNLQLKAEVLSSVIFWNEENDGMVMEELPMRAQLSPVFAIHSKDITGDDRSEVVMGGNLYGVQPRAGSYDAGRGVVMKAENGSIDTFIPHDSGMNIEGEIRAILTLNLADGSELLVVARYDNTPVLYRINNQNTQ